MAKKDRGPGFSGITCKHLYKLCTQTSIALEGLLRLANACLAKVLPDEQIFDDLKLSKGIPLFKPNKSNPQQYGCRPICVNESFLTALAKLCLSQLEPLFPTILHPNDYGCGKSGGMDAVIHGLRALHRDAAANDKPFYILKTDFTNAFNSIDRQVIIDVVHSKCPQLLPFLHFRYTNLNVLFIDKHTELRVQSTTGVVQGDGLSSFLFQLSMSHILQKARQHCTIPSYLDDNYIFSPCLEKLHLAAQLLKSESKEHNLLLNDKSELYPYRDLSEEDKTLFPMHSSVRIVQLGVIVLGSFLGPNEATSAFVQSKFNTMLQQVDQFQDLVRISHGETKLVGPHQQPITHQLLNFIRYCLCSLPTHVLRTIPSILTANAAISLDKALIKCVLSLVESNLFPCQDLKDIRHVLENPTTSTASKAAISARRIFTKKGGLGLTSPSLAAHPAYLGSIALSAALVSNILHHTNPRIDNQADLTRILDLQQAMDFFPNKACTFQTDHHPYNVNLHPRRKVQRALYKLLQQRQDDFTTDLVLQHHQSTSNPDPRYAQRFVSACHPWAGALQYSNPQLNYARLTNQQFQDFISMRIGCAPPLPLVCSFCKRPIQNGLEINHGFGNCAIAGLSASGKAVKYGVRSACSLLLLNPSSYEPLLAQHIDFTPTTKTATEDPNGETKRGDFTINFKGNEIITDPTMSAAYILPKPHQAPDLTPCILANSLVTKKHKDYSKHYKYNPISFRPFGLESDGAPSDSLVQLFDEQVQILKDQDLLPSKDVHIRAIRLVSQSIAKANSIRLNQIRFGKRVPKLPPDSPVSPASPSSPRTNHQKLTPQQLTENDDDPNRPIKRPKFHTGDEPDSSQSQESQDQEDL